MDNRKLVPLKKSLKNIHTFNVQDKFFLFNAERLSIFKINKMIWDVINHLGKHNIREALNGLKGKYEATELYEAIDWYREASGKLDNKKIKNKPSFRQKKKSIRSKNSPIDKFCNLSQISGVTLYVSNDCNLECAYCADRNIPKKKMNMTTEVAERTMDFLMEHSGKNIDISFYGGEPLLNFGIIKHAVAYIQKLNKKYSKKISFSISTNGTICNMEIIKFLAKFNFDVLISLDGPQEIHDEMRCFPNGKGTHAIVLENIKKYFSKYLRKKPAKISCVTHPGNFKRFKEIYFYLSKIEDKFGMAVNAFSTTEWRDDEKRFTLSAKKLEEFKEIIEECAVLTLDRCLKNNSYRSYFDPMDLSAFIEILSDLKPVKTYCDSGIKGFVVFPDGCLIPCGALYNDKQALIFGNILNLKEIDDKKRLSVYYSTKTSPKGCDNCWLKKICSVNCPAYNYYHNDNYRLVYMIKCERHKKVFECAVWLLSELKKHGIKDIKF